MKQKHIASIAVLIIALVFLTGCGGSSTTGGEAKAAEKSEPATKITATGIGTTMVISPSKDKVISGIVTITATKVPSETGVMGFSIEGGNVPKDSSNMNIALDQDDSDGWVSPFDTTEYDNGAYKINIIAGSADFQRMLGSASANVIIEN